MASLEEVISKTAEEDYYSDPIQFIIDSDLRIVSIPRRGVVAGVVGDKNVNRINFQMPRFYNGIDMSQFTARVNYVNAKSIGNFYMVDDLKIVNDSIVFTWLIDSDVVEYAGKILFSINMTMTDEKGVIKQAFNTSNAGSLNALDGIKVNDYVPPEEQENILSKLEKESSKYIENVMKSITETAVKEVSAKGDAEVTRVSEIGKEVKKSIDDSCDAAIQTKTALDTSNEMATQIKKSLDKTTDIASELDESLNAKVEDGVQSDWAQNDNTAVGYVKNRPCYKSYEEVTVDTFDNGDGVFYAELDGFTKFKAGDEVTLKIDGVRYSMIAYADGQAFIIGDDLDSILNGSGNFGWAVGYLPDGDRAAFMARDSHTITYRKETIHKLSEEYIPEIYHKIPRASDIFGGSLIGGTRIESTRKNPYPNKETLNNLSIETFNGMLDGSVDLPKFVEENGYIASVSSRSWEKCIKVSWHECSFYGINGVGIAGVLLEFYEAKIHEDDTNSGSVVSECAMVNVYNKSLN